MKLGELVGECSWKRSSGDRDEPAADTASADLDATAPPAAAAEDTDAAASALGGWPCRPADPPECGAGPLRPSATGECTPTSPCNGGDVLMVIMAAAAPSTPPLLVVPLVAALPAAPVDSPIDVSAGDSDGAMAGDE